MPPSSVIVSPVLKESAAQMPQVRCRSDQNAGKRAFVQPDSREKEIPDPERAALLQIRSRADGGTVNQHLVKGEKR